MGFATTYGYYLVGYLVSIMSGLCDRWWAGLPTGVICIDGVGYGVRGVGYVYAYVCMCLCV